MRSSQVKTCLVLICGTMLVTAFQNCGGVKFNGGSSSSSSDQRATAGDVVTPESAGPVASGSCALLGAAHATTAESQFIQGAANLAVITDVGFLHLNGITAGDVVVDNADRVLAQNLNGGLTAATVEAHVMDVAGSVCVTAARVTQVKNVRGVTRLRGVSPAGQPAILGPVLDVRDLEIENFAGPLIQNVHGHLTLTASYVRTVQDVTGRIDLNAGAVIEHLIDSPNAQIYRDGVPVAPAF